MSGPHPDSDKICRSIDGFVQDIKHETRASSVQILVTFRDGDGDTVCYGSGAGSFYERIGAAQTWINRETTK